MNIQETYLKLLRQAVLLGKNEEVRDKNISEDLPCDFVEEVVQMAQRHGTGPLVFNELLKAIDRLQVTGDRLQAMAMQMKQICMQNMLLQGQWEQVIAKAWKALGGDRQQAIGDRVEAVLMKGFAYARLYSLPYLRSWGDLDIWVGPEQYHQACGLLREAFPEAKHHDEEWDELKHYCFVFPDGKSIELHRVSMDFINKKDQAYWCKLEREAIGDRQQVTGDRIQVAGVEVPMWEPKFDILFCFMHSWEHFCGSGIPLKQVCDLALLVKKLHTGSDPMCSFEETETYLAKHLKALKMLEVWKYYGYMACKALGISASEWPLLIQNAECTMHNDVVKYGERLYERVMEEGQCRVREYEDGSKDRYEARDKAKKMNFFARKMMTLKSRLSSYYFLKEFAPKYARHILAAEIKKGIKRTLTGAKMIDY